ncbi:patatin-like phospholipase family protein [Alteraurantiacibacter aquimixticola]|uniref:Patatin-like phospholipase family protein n=1 Tax=Alteraurantiacibacter aquimixticola TaxID=2489173 RepID=A0A4T3F2G2_9SPHN|nr:patatin-like phospholipase family protein [Alteraurantiacibacter aquimixticola]TIX48790.1 patatin-like phospholipase family protein [Alteraurantiacibacter aquimixticola]
MEEEEQRYFETEQPEWGLALSGGGLRSAMFSVGFLKGLWDIEQLDKIEVVSSVSGGGYAAFWLYSDQLRAADPRMPFGHSALSDERFGNQLCRLVSRGNFVPYSRLFSLVGPNFRFRSISLYEDALLRTFAGDSMAGLPISDLAGIMERGPNPAPYLIQNASIDATRSWNTRLLEFTPLFYGNGQSRYGWGDANGTALPFVKTSAISGAAFAPLNQWLGLIDPGNSGSRNFVANDGGLSENLGAFALIRRGVRNIIVTDAEHDPGYIFNAYRNLRAGLAAHGLALRVPQIEDHMFYNGNAPFEHWAVSGTVRDMRTGNLVSNIYYVKATLTQGQRTTLSTHLADGSIGQGEVARYGRALNESTSGGKTDCDTLSLDRPLDLAPWASHHVAGYANSIDSSLKSDVVRRLGINDAIIDFPQYSTGDQSFYTDQSSAFIGLGYLEALALREVLAGQSAQ